MSKEYKCQYCGKDFSENKSPQGAVNLHEYRCKAKPKNKAKVEKKENDDNITRCGICNTKLRMLTPSNENHIGAIENDFDFYCPNCKELY